MKKLIALLLVLILLCGLLIAYHIKEPTPNPVSDFEYEINDEGGITITGMTRYVHFSDSEKMVIPSVIDGKNVTKIGKRAFDFNSFAAVYIPDTVTEIGENAFSECQSLKEVRLSSALTTLGACAFAACTKLTQITLPGSLTAVPANAFIESAIETVVFEEGITSIGECAFYGTALKEVDIPGSVKTIERGAFAECFGLQAVTLREGLVSVGDYAFGGRGALTPCNKLTEIVIPKTVTDITQGTFHGDTLLTSVKFEGNAPEGYGEKAQDTLNYTVYYHADATGFTSPTWNGYETSVW